MTQYYELARARSPWGDYGDFLWHGMMAHPDGAHSETVKVLRTGPFVPPITCPFGGIIVTDAFRTALSDANFTGLAFEPVDYGKVVRIEWDGWDRNAAEPRFYPSSGEPEGYIYDQNHDTGLASAMPKLWAWKVVQTVGLQVERTNTFRDTLHPKTDVAREHHIVWITERLKMWLADTAGEWVRFVPVVPR
jgi:hypothetical protein